MAIHMRQFSFILISGLAVADVMTAEPALTAPPANFEATMQRGRDELKAGRVAEAEALFQQACPADIIPTFAAPKAGSCYHHLGAAAAIGTHPATAPALFQSASQAWRAAGPEFSVAWGNTLLTLADLYQQQRQPTKSEEMATTYLNYLRENGKTRDSAYAETLSRLAVSYADTGRPALARTVILEALDIFAKLPNPKALEIAHARNTLGLVSLSMGLQTEAEASLRIAREIAAAQLGEMHPETAGFQTNLALTLLAKSDLNGAETLLRQARSVMERTGGASDNQFGMLCAELSAVALLRNKLATAEDEAKRALDIFSHQEFPDRRSVALAQVSLADVHLHANRLQEAERLLLEAIPSERRAAPQSRLLADGLRRLAQLRSMQGRYREAQDLYREAIEVYELRLGPRHPSIAPLLRAYAETLKKDGAPKAEVRIVETRAKSIGVPGTAGFAPRE